MKVHEYDVFLNENRIPYLKQVRDTGLTDADELCSPQAVSDTVRRLYHVKQLPEEHVWLLALDAKNHMIGTFEISRGTYNRTASFRHRLYNGRYFVERSGSFWSTIIQVEIRSRAKRTG